MDWIYFIILGLMFDIAGAGVVVSPLLFLSRLRAHPRWMGEEVWKQRKFAWIGFGLLALGFALQGYGNYLQFANK